MKYGMRERISGAVILLALAVIFIPMLFDDSPSREEPPEPVLTIEQPVEIERKAVEAPQPPSSLGQIQDPLPLERNLPDLPSTEPELTEAEPAAEEPMDEADETSAPQAVESEAHSDPITALTRQIERQEAERDTGAESASSEPAPSTQTGEWAVQVGSFKKAENAERLEAKLNSEGIGAFRKSRDDTWTTVYVGPFETSEAGEKVRTELKEKSNINGFLIRVREDG